MKINYTIEEIDNVAMRVLERIGENTCVALYGQMGSGKTTLIKAMCRILGVKDVVNSPTFTLVNEYLTEQGRSVYHFDFYRIKRLEEVYDIGFDEYVESQGLSLIEWPEMMEELLPENTLSLRITLEKDGSRTIED